MPISEHRPRGAVSAQGPWKFTVHPVCALDGTLIVVLKGGETVGHYFGATEREAAAAAAADIRGVLAGRTDGDAP